MSGFPRRINVDRWSKAEAAISEAVQAVEALSADERLTRAILLLEQAQNEVWDYVDATLANSTTNEGEK